MYKFFSLMIEHVEVRKRLHEVTEMVKPFSKLWMTSDIYKHVDSCNAQRRYLEGHLEDFEKIEAQLQELAKGHESLSKKLVERSPDFAKVHREAVAVVKKMLRTDGQSDKPPTGQCDLLMEGKRHSLDNAKTDKENDMGHITAEYEDMPKGERRIAQASIATDDSTHGDSEAESYKVILHIININIILNK